ncbi:hypothetical protein Tco_0218951 [Tanacetum coccineum]
MYEAIIPTSGANEADLEHGLEHAVSSSYRAIPEKFLLHAYLQQYELHANEVRIMRERNHDPLALVVNHQMTSPHFNTYQSSYDNPPFQQ